jgi:hypothetical protein
MVEPPKLELEEETVDDFSVFKLHIPGYVSKQHLRIRFYCS